MTDKVSTPKLFDGTARAGLPRGGGARLTESWLASVNVTNHSAESNGLFVALALLFIGAFLRCPPILLHGRVWAEESSIFLIGAWSRSFSGELFAPEFGYYSVWDNFFAALSSHVVPLPEVALLFTWSAVLLLLVVGYFVYQAEFLPSRTAKTVAVLALLLTPPSVETWLNLINSEFFFGIAAAVILFSNATRLRLARGLMLALAVLSGPLTTLLAPLFLLRALLRRRRAELVQAAIVCVGALLQVMVHFTTRTNNRAVKLQPLTLGPVLFNKQVVLLFFDRFAAKKTFLVLQDRLHFSPVTLAITWLLAVAASLAVAWLLRRNRVALLVFGVAVFFAVVESALALNGGLNHVGPGAGERYAFTPNYLIELALIALAFTAAAGWRRTAVRTLLALALLSGLADYLLLPLRDRGAWQGEPWHAQALRWERDPATSLFGTPTSWPAFHLPRR